MELSDYPSLYAVADSAADKAKRNYYRLLAAQLLIFVLISFAGTLASQGTERGRLFSKISAFLLGASLIVSWVNRAQHYDKGWYECRAVAEAVKTLTWRYMMQADPFRAGLEPAEASRKFVAELQAIRKTYSGAIKDLGDYGVSPTIFSNYMNETRESSWQNRSQRYLQERLEPERVWYERNARLSRSQSEKWLWFTIILQLLALFFAIVQPSLHVSFLNPVSFFMTIASVITAWNQAKRHDEVAQSYSATAQVLGEFQGTASTEATDPASLEAFVAKVEQVLAKERATWLIKKSVPSEVEPDAP